MVGSQYLKWWICSLKYFIIQIYCISIEVVEAINMINDFKEGLNYVPAKLFYQEVDLETIG